MKLNELATKLELKELTAVPLDDRKVVHGQVGDMLSDVMGRAPEGAAWVTIQTHKNTVAVAVMRSLAAIIFAGGREPTPTTVDEANERGVPLFTSEMTSFEIAGRMYELGLRGKR